MKYYGKRTNPCGRKHNADLPKDENYVDECLNYKDIYEVKEMVLDDL